MPRRGQSGRPPRKLRPLEPRNTDDEFTAERRARADDRFESTMYDLKHLGFIIKRHTLSVKITCKHGSFERQLPWHLDAYDSDPDHWAHLTERIRLLHREHCGKET